MANSTAAVHVEENGLKTGISTTALPKGETETYKDNSHNALKTRQVTLWLTAGTQGKEDRFSPGRRSLHAAQGSGEQAPMSRALPEWSQKSSKTRELADGSVTRVGSILKSEPVQGRFRGQSGNERKERAAHRQAFQTTPGSCTDTNFD